MSDKLEVPVLNATPVTATGELTPDEQAMLEALMQKAGMAYSKQSENGVRVDAVYATQLTALNRRNEKDPHFFGSVKLNGLWYQKATWINVNNDTQNLSTSYTLMDKEQADKAEEREQKFQEQRRARANPLSAPPVNPLAGEIEKESAEMGEAAPDNEPL